MDNNIDLNRRDDAETTTGPRVNWPINFETDFDVWKDYFFEAYRGLINSSLTADWNEFRIIEKAEALANLAFGTEKAKKEEMG